MKLTAEIEIDENQYVMICQKDKLPELVHAVQVLYRRVWSEACYDAYNEETQLMARELLPHIETVKELLGIKK